MNMTWYRRLFEFLRTTTDEDGNVAVHKTGFQASGILSSMSRADCFIVLLPECAGVEPGEQVDVEVFEGMV